MARRALTNVPRSTSGIYLPQLSAGPWGVPLYEEPQVECSASTGFSSQPARLASTLTNFRVNYFPHLSTNKQPINVTQERQTGHAEQGRDRSAHHVLRSSMSEPIYFTRSSIVDPDVGIGGRSGRGMITPKVAVVEGAAHVSTADFPMPMRHSMTEPAVFDEVQPEMNRKIS